MSKKMSSKQAALYCLLLALVLHADHTSASLAGSCCSSNCIYTSPAMPFCAGWMCKTECWTEAKLIGASVQGRKCMKGGFKGWCSCFLCRN
ncbi:hypothetical protein PVAP13_7NG097636 [Panicum virgatum]|uniref:Uncharacterized protein n=1 Tax=Panicum virgatum TaxID=38727 RepID=A0A8T0PSG6_PANVG|nr:hypothetical protein PVAP13_7NG097636 [Panicum virgatum]